MAMEESQLTELANRLDYIEESETKQYIKDMTRMQKQLNSAKTDKEIAAATNALLYYNIQQQQKMYELQTKYLKTEVANKQNQLIPFCKDFNEDLILSKVLEIDINAINNENIQQSLQDFNKNLDFFNRVEAFIYEHLKQQSFEQGIQIAARIYYALNQKSLEIPQELRQSMEKNLTSFNQKLIAFEEKMQKQIGK